MRSIYEDLAGLIRLLGTTALSLVLVGSFVVGQAAWSEETETEDEDEEGAYTEDIYLMEEAIVVGSRHAPRSEKESAAPVDVLNADELRTQAAVDMDDMLRTLAPSYNIQRHGIDDEATLVRPATLRGLPPDNLLVLVNGKRRHRSGVIALLGSSLNTGSQGPDLSVIPAIALRQMELLRDGAAAQYGSDAIAGVLNLRLREASEGVLVETRGGQYFEGDGSLYQVATNVGLPLTEDGFFNVSVEYRQSDPTIRSGQRANAATLRERGYPVKEPAQIWGSPDLDGVWNTFFNSGVDLGNGTEAYSFGGWAKRRAEGGFFFRAPGTSSARSSVFRIGGQRAVADLDPDDDIDLANLEVPSLDSSFDETQAFVDEYQGDLFLFNERFPGWFYAALWSGYPRRELGGWSAQRPLRRPQVGCQRQRRPQQHRILHLQYHQRLAGAGYADVVPPARLHSDRSRGQPRLLLRDGGGWFGVAARPRLGRGMAPRDL